MSASSTKRPNTEIDRAMSATGPGRTRLPKTALHLIGALAAVVGLCAAMLLMTLATLSRLDAAEQEVSHLDRAKHAAHIVEAQVREQYIHQAHCIIELGLTHLPRYREAVATTHAAIAHLRQLTRRPQDRSKVNELARLAEHNDRQFRERVVPAIRESRRAALVELHGEIEPVVTRVTRVNAELSEILNGRSARARAQAAALRQKTRTMALLCFAVAFAVALLVGVLLTRRIGGRIVALRSGALRLAAGDLDHRIHLPGDDEFVQLAQTFNHMATELSEQQRRLLRAERLASIGQVAAGVAHEINNPLGVILGYVKLLRRKLGDQHTDTVQIIEDEARLCQRIVDDLLELARPQELRLGQVDLVALTQDVVHRLSETGKLQHLDLVLPTPDTRVVVVGDEEKLKQVIGNLLVNAADACGERGTITITAGGNADDTAWLSVHDSGPGMPEDVRARVFEPFFTSKRGGVGLGLAIAQAIADAHRGRLEISCPATGGTQATLHVATRTPAEPSSERTPGEAGEDE